MSEALINGLAGAGGGIIAQLITYPLQTVSARQQTDRGESHRSRRGGVLPQIYGVIQHEGWQRLYGGLAPSLVGTAASQGVYYYFYQVFRSRAEKTALSNFKRGVGDGSIGMFQALVSAALSGCMNVLLTNPIWVVVTRMQTTRRKKMQTNPSSEPLLDVKDKSSYGTSQTVREIYDEAGIFGFWKGVLPTLIMVSNPSIQFMLYEGLLKKLRARRAAKGSSSVTALEFFLLGAIAKLGATVSTYPLLVVKSRLQAKQVVSGDKNHNYRGTADAITKMIRHEGLSGFYKGMSTKIMQSVLTAAVLFMIKEEIVKGVRLLVGSSRHKPHQ
ncbi:mitochondrial substrate carrier family protein [Wolffia australiana]